MKTTRVAGWLDHIAAPKGTEAIRMTFGDDADSYLLTADEAEELGRKLVDAARVRRELEEGL